MKSVGDLIIELHDLARSIEDSEESFKVRLLANELAIIGNRLHEKNSGIIEYLQEKISNS